MQQGFATTRVTSHNSQVAYQFQQYLSRSPHTTQFSSPTLDNAKCIKSEK